MIVAKSYWDWQVQNLTLISNWAVQNIRSKFRNSDLTVHVKYHGNIISVHIKKSVHGTLFPAFLHSHSISYKIGSVCMSISLCKINCLFCISTHVAFDLISWHHSLTWRHVRVHHSLTWCPDVLCRELRAMQEGALTPRHFHGPCNGLYELLI